MSAILIVDYGLCNLDSVKRAVEGCGGKAEISDSPASLADAEKIILPGVGNFSDAARLMAEHGWNDAIRDAVIHGERPILGICLGMQLLASHGTESGSAKGLGLIPGRVVRLEAKSKTERIPHVGWNEVHFTENELFRKIPNAKDFYFTHSFHFVPDSQEHVLARTPYCGGFVSAVRKDRVLGVQFHPEKSQLVGQQIIRNFLEL